MIQELEQYFTNNEDPQVLSFVSLPLLRVTPQSEEGIGVLNIHRNTKGLLEEKEPVEHFVPLLGPFESILLRLLEILDNLKTPRRDAFEQ